MNAMGKILVHLVGTLESKIIISQFIFKLPIYTTFLVSSFIVSIYMLIAGSNKVL